MIDLLKEVDHNQVDPLPFYIIYTNIVYLWLHRHSLFLKPAQYWCIWF